MSQIDQKQWQNKHPQSCRTWIPERSVVLVIEPHAMWRIFLKAVLNLYQYQVVTAATEQEAEALKQEVAPVDLGLVIADIHLSDDLQARAGVRLFERWTATAPTLPFLLMSDHADDANLPVVRAGTVSFLAKPVIRGEVLEAVARHLAKAHPTNNSRSHRP